MSTLQPPQISPFEDLHIPQIIILILKSVCSLYLLFLLWKSKQKLNFQNSSFEKDSKNYETLYYNVLVPFKINKIRIKTAHYSLLICCRCK